MCVSGLADHTAATRYKPNEVVPRAGAGQQVTNPAPLPPPADSGPHLRAKQCEAEPLVNERLWAAEV